MRKLFFIFVLLFSLPVQANQLDTSDNISTGFDATAVNSLPTGWVAISGSWSAQTTNALTGHTHTLANTTHTDGQIALDENPSTTADMDISYVTTVGATSASNQSGMGVVARADSGFTQAYAFVYTTTAGLIFKRTSSTYAQINNTAHGLTLVAGNIIAVRFQTVGTTIRWKLWRVTSAEPSAWTASITDSSVSAAGYAGVYNQDPGGLTATGTFSDYTVSSINSTTTLINISPTSVTGTLQNTIPVTGIYGGTAPNALNYSIDGGGYVAANTPTIAGGNFSFTIPTPANGYHAIDVQENNATSTTGTGIYNSIVLTTIVSPQIILQEGF